MLRLTLFLFLLSAVAPAWSQTPRSTLSRGFDAKAPAVATAQEMAQGGLWVLEVEFKPLRLTKIEVTDPETGENREEWVWYLVYRAQNKPLQSPVTEDGRTPVNNYDPPPGPPLFIPEFQLITDKNNVQTVHADVVLPDALEQIARREMRGTDAERELKNSVQVVQPIPPPEDQSAEPIYGVATWTGIDPRVDFYRIYAGGFSNGFQEITGPDGNPLILRREIVLDVWRPGDEFDLAESEFQLREEPRWIYRADDADPSDLGQDALTSAPVAKEEAAE